FAVPRAARIHGNHCVSAWYPIQWIRARKRRDGGHMRCLPPRLRKTVRLVGHMLAVRTPRNQRGRRQLLMGSKNVYVDARTIAQPDRYIQLSAQARLESSAVARLW